MNISFTPQVVKVTAQPPGLKAQTAAASGNVIITPQALAVSALSTALDVNTGVQIIRGLPGMTFERGEWTQDGDAGTVIVPFENQHETAPWFYIVGAKEYSFRHEAYSVYGQLFVNHYAVFGHSMPTYWDYSYTSSYGFAVLWSTQNANGLATNTRDLTWPPTSPTENPNADDIRHYCTNEKLVLDAGVAWYSNPNSYRYFRNGNKFEWLAVWAAE